jgi:hypothetical protein
MAAETSQQNAHHACVVYDPQSGKIHHIHQVAVLPGAESPTQHEIEERALSLARKISPHVSTGLKALHVAPQSLKPRSRHRVNLENLTIVSESMH